MVCAVPWLRIPLGTPVIPPIVSTDPIVHAPSRVFTGEPKGLADEIAHHRDDFPKGRRGEPNPMLAPSVHQEGRLGKQ